MRHQHKGGLQESPKGALTRFSSQQDRNQIAKKSSRAQIPWEVPQRSLRADGRSTLLLSNKNIVLKSS